MPRTPKLDAVLADAQDAARAALARHVPEAQVGDHLGVSAEGDRLVMHRFEAKRRGYAGWYWYVTLARGPRVKVATVCDSGLLPGENALLAPAWVPWADRVAPEELAEEKAREAAEAAGGTAEQAGDGDESSAPATPAEPTTTAESAEVDEAASAGAPESADAPAAASDAAEAPNTDSDAAAHDDGAEQTRPRRRRRARRRAR
ncbi:DUF3027 domain-containing protein [Zhihengliuella flava]|uniref:DUF3027 domain-containing protein n=1 Tax=Zhihengliuella flava TaxID=1285193 RepID=A0A931DA37_9MICC|nr:DUF3027 domain-containing protein [Zhihengliuella flava]MBG6085237.1 hypothetical protein [Zhihengliuella flava]